MLRTNSSDSIAATPESVVRRILLCSRDIVFVFACLANVDFYGTCAAARGSIHLEWGAVSETHCQKVHQVAAATRKTPLIVVPSHYLDAVCSYGVREIIYDRRIRIPAEVRRDELLFAERKYALHRTFVCLPESGINTLCSGRLLCQDG